MPSTATNLIRLPLLGPRSRRHPVDRDCYRDDAPQIRGNAAPQYSSHPVKTSYFQKAVWQTKAVGQITARRCLPPIREIVHDGEYNASRESANPVSSDLVPTIQCIPPLISLSSQSERPRAMRGWPTLQSPTLGQLLYTDLLELLIGL